MAYNPNNPNGQATAANSAPVVIASNQTAIPVTSAGIPAALGQTTMSGSQPVTIASNQTALLTTNASLPAALGQQAAATSLAVTLSNENVQDAYVIGQSAQTAIINNIIPVVAGATATDSIGYRNMSTQVISTGTAGTYIFEGSNDNVNFQTIPVYSQLIATGAPILAAITATASSLVYVYPVPTRYVRLRIVSAITGGNIQAFTKSSQVQFAPAFFTASQSTPANLQTTATIASGTVTTVGTVTTMANGQTAHSAASTGSPVRAGGRVNTTLDTTLVQGDASDLFMSTAGQLVEKPYSTAENDWQATSGITALATTTSTALTAAGAASIRNYVTGLQLYNTSATVSTVISILDGATVIWTGFVPATTAALPVVDIHVVFPTPLRGTASTGMNIQCGTVAANVFYNVQGYKSF